MGNPVRFVTGVSTQVVTDVLGNYPLSDRFETGSLPTLGVSEYTQDFVALPSGDYTITGSSSTFALHTGVEGGAALMTPGGATTATAAYRVGNSFKFVAGQQAWFNCRFQVSAVAGNVAYYVGLRAGSSANDGLWFAKAAASTSINLVSTVGSAAATLVTGVATAVLATWVKVGFYFNGTDLLVYADGALVARVAAPTIGASSTTLTSALLTPVFQMTPTATDTMTIDYVLASTEVLR